jgi:hypothetical protein
MQLTIRYPSQQPQTVRCTPQGNIELMTKIEILDFKPAPRLEQVGDKRPKQMGLPIGDKRKTAPSEAILPKRSLAFVENGLQQDRADREKSTTSHEKGE